MVQELERALNGTHRKQHGTKTELRGKQGWRNEKRMWDREGKTEKGTSL